MRFKGNRFPEYYDVPLCIVDVNEEAATLVFAVRIVGP